jgi:hypothetical protein
MSQESESTTHLTNTNHHHGSEAANKYHHHHGGEAANPSSGVDLMNPILPEGWADLRIPFPWLPSKDFV